jgi:hypothetical protein
MIIQTPASDGPFHCSRSPQNAFQSSAQYPHTHARYPYFYHPSAPESQGTLPHNTDFELMQSGERSGGATSGQWSSHSSQDLTNHLGTPFVDHGMGPVHPSLNLVMSEVQRLSAQVVELQEQNATCFDKVEGQLNTLKAASPDRNRATAKTSAGKSKGGSNDTPLLKVC